MKRFFCVIVLLLAGASAPLAQEPITVKTETVRRDGVLARVNFSVTNHGSTTESVFASCTFFAGASPLETHKALVTHIKPGQKAFGEASVPDDKSITGADCRFDQFSAVKF